MQVYSNVQLLMKGKSLKGDKLLCDHIIYIYIYTVYILFDDLPTSFLLPNSELAIC
jgi:hypothetical protein